MTVPASPDLSRAAVLVMDYQPAILGMIDDADAMIGRSASLAQAARTSRRPVIYVRVAFREGYPEVSGGNLMFSGIKAAGRLLITDPASEIDARIAPASKDAVVLKHRVSAFSGTALEIILRAAEIDTLVLLGVSTSGVVLSTVRDAADRDFRILVVEDACADPDAETHRFLVEKVFPRQAAIAPTSEVLAALEKLDAAAAR